MRSFVILILLCVILKKTITKSSIIVNDSFNPSYIESNKTELQNQKIKEQEPPTDIFNENDDNKENNTSNNDLNIEEQEENCMKTTEQYCKKLDKNKDASQIDKETNIFKACGYRNPDGLDFNVTAVAKGDESLYGEFPWVVAILDSINSAYLGVGGLIHPRVVITCAHIFPTFPPKPVKIHAGKWETKTVRLNYQERISQEIYIHRKFGPKSHINNIALVLLKEEVQLADHINVICMPEEKEDFSHYKDCIANGWGKDKFGSAGRYAVVLKRVLVNMVDRERCNTLLKRTKLGPNFQLHNSFICAGGEKGIDTCEGDGGAPLVCPIGNNRYKLTGLVSWGIGCGEKDVPAVYTAVANFRKWVDKKMATWLLDNKGYVV